MKPGKIRVIPLGSRGWIPAGNRQTGCYAVEYRDRLLVLDAGSGMARFAEPPGQEILSRYDTVYLLLSHYHLDHIAGLIFMPAIFRGKTVHIAAPGRAIYPGSSQDILTALIQPPYFSRPLMQFPMELYFHNLAVGASDLDGMPVETIFQPHSDPSLGIRIDQTICYLTDTPCQESALDFCRGARLLLHEAWLDEGDYRELQSRQQTSPDARKHLETHARAAAAAELARKAGVDSLLLIHLNPTYDETRLAAMEAACQQIFRHTSLARDGQALCL